MPKMQQHATDTIAPPSAPLLGNHGAHGPVPGDAMDDIADPALPAGMAEAMRAAAIPGMPVEAPPTAQEASNGTPPPAVPATVPALPENLLPLAHGFCQYLQAQFGAKLEETAIGMTKEVSATIDGMTRYAQGVLQSNEHVGYQLSDALLQAQDKGLTVHGSPYEMTLQVSTPAGIPLTLTIRKASAADLLDELTRLETWLDVNGYRGERPAGVAA